jgi:putative hydrolase of the HAD superfamily
LPAVLHWDGTPIEALLLDLDDTILDNAAGLEAAWRSVADAVAAELGGVSSEAVLEQLRTSSDWFWADDERHRWGRLDMPGSRRSVIEHVFASLGRPSPVRAAEIAELYSRLRDAALAPFPGALEALARLRAKAPALGLVTNGAAAPQRAKIDRFDLARFFDVIVVEGEIGHGKPDPRNFQHALDAIGAAPEHALMAGDNFECDVLGALGAGVQHAVWIVRADRPYRTPGAGKQAPLARPHHTLASFVELVERLGI